MKWLRMKDVLSSMTQRPVEIVLSTELSDNLRSAIEFSDTNVLLCLNAKYSKNDDDIIETVAHEIAHVIVGNNQHNTEWELAIPIVKMEFVERMGKECLKK